MTARSVRVDDVGLVRAPAPVVYRFATDMVGWGGWWPDVRTVGSADGRVRMVIGRRPGRVVLDLAPHGWRHDRGFRWDVGGDLAGAGELWLEPVGEGTLVHHVADLTVVRGGSSVADRYRRAFRVGLWALKDQLEAAVRLALGRAP